jgi:hypothetical protein
MSVDKLIDRREFLKLSAASSIVAGTGHNTLASVRSFRPQVPTLDDLASVTIRHTFGDLFNLPLAMNDLGFAQSVKSVSAITAIAIPPYACCGFPEITWSPGFLTTCEVIVDDRLLSICPPPENRINYKWFPHCVVREQVADGLRFKTSMFMPADRRAVAQSITVHNLSEARRKLTLGFDMRAAVTKKTAAWFFNSPGEGDNKITWSAEQGRLTFEAQHSAAASAQGLVPKAQRLQADNVLMYELELGVGETREFHYVNAIAENGVAANRLYDELQRSYDQVVQENERKWDGLIRSAFTPGNSDFSGHLPRLLTDDESLWNLYYNGFKNLLSARRRSPDSAYGATLITLSGHVLPTLSFPWDTALSGLSLALLDPDPLRNLVEVWFQQDMHAHLATDHVSGEAVGPSYGVNDMAIVRCAQDYLRVTGRFDWLDKRVGSKTVLEHIKDHALHWTKLQTTDRKLGDYGKIENLLEVVSTYLHEVAGMNAGNVSSMRFVAELLEHRGDSEGARHLRAEAVNMAGRINRLLYVQGKGWWRCGQPDGSFHEVRHCYDFLTVLDNMAEDLSAVQKEEMAHFFWEQLHSEKWMRALASGDPDASWNIRPDHSCLGAYAAWPPMSAKGLYKIDDPVKIAPWLRELAKAGSQGPIGQAHCTEEIFPPEHGGAYKSPEDAPYLNDWCVIAGGAFSDLVIESIFGADLTLFKGVRATPHLAEFDPNARLQNLHYQDAEYTLSAKGAKKQA